MKKLILFFSLSLIFYIALAQETNFLESVQHHYANNDGVKIHYVSLGEGPLVVMVHGFPDYWYSWRHQMEALSGQFRVIALDQRGYNKSDQPKGVENYNINLLVNDVAAVIQDAGEEKAIVVGHDWGGMVSWTLAMTKPEMVEKLIICNLPHPKGLSRELANNPEQQKNSEYARRFQKKGAHLVLTAKRLSSWVKDEDARALYMEAFKRSDFKAMLNYYKANYPRPPYEENVADLPKVKCPVLMFHGLDDTALLSDGLNNTWDWLEQDLTLITIPGAGHFVQHDAADMVSRNIRMWLNR